MKTFLQSKCWALRWEDCYPLGNGNIGVMDSCNPLYDSIWLNDDTFWSGYGKDKSVEAPGALAAAREAILADKFSEGEKDYQQAYACPVYRVLPFFRQACFFGLSLCSLQNTAAAST